ncbi:arylesterase [Variovorax paradoxus]|nr:arylesterase [Variovorax paradoxus]KPV02342.1 arylesterase [Variovorax paradoxus]KPV10059.1 arylesterase [Variovorax paradoxus]KPV19781.1 arylesterase [Variovorax paradoxus]KPV27827.1 arylesterase [Variovorax paradoxus]
MNRRDFILTTAALGSSGPWRGAMAQGAAARKPVILVLGDSLSAEYGLKRGEGWVPLLEKRLAQQKIDATVVNASISGDTSSGGRARFAALLAQHKPSHVVLELGANDALRGLPLTDTEANLLQITQSAQAAGAKVLIVGIQVPPNYGGDYTRRFEAVFAKVASTTRSALVPFLLKGVADAPNAMSLFQADRIHPTAAAQPQLLDNVWPELRKLLAAK